MTNRPDEQDRDGMAEIEAMYGGEVGHTPGPWVKGEPYTINDPNLVFVLPIRAAVDGRLVCEIRYPGQPENQSNADLICAASDLLAACKLQLAALDGKPYDFKSMLAAHRALDAAVAKAEGKS